MERKCIRVSMTPFRRQREQVLRNPGNLYSTRFTESLES
uniref:Uncharacterized protein n=1 Tax=Arundo donax TaxID=35708 RepID=A0A0A9EFV3_ARUDO